MKRAQLLGAAWLLALLIGGTAAAENPAALASLSLEQLMDIEVTSASKVPASLASAPTSTVIITRDELRRFGYRTVADALKNVIGINVFTNQYSYANFRGIAIGGDFDTRVLLLVDGHKTNDPNYHQGYIGDEFEGEIENVERIEVTKGPASSVWGTNAMLALINVVTRKGSSVGGTEVTGEYGSFQRGKVSTSSGNKTEGGLEYNLNASYTHSDGDDDIKLQGRGDAGTLEARNSDAQYLYRLSGRFDYEDLHLLVSGGSRKKEIPYGYFGTTFGDGSNYYEDSFAYMDLSYDKVIDRDSNSRFFARFFYDYTGFSADSVYLNEDNTKLINHDIARGKNFGLEARYSRDIAEHLSGLVGVEVTDFYQVQLRNFDRIPASQDYITANDPFTLSSYYAELHYAPLKEVEFVGGARGDTYSNQDDAVTPRASIITHPFESSTVRFMYGEGFRVADNFERNYADERFTVSNHDIRPEKLRSYEIAIQQKIIESVQANMSLYRLRFHDLIQQTQIADSVFQYRNQAGDITSHGLEFSLDARLKSGWLASTGFSLIRAERESERLPASASSLFNARVSAPLYKNQLYLSPQVRYVSSLAAGGGISKMPPYWVADINLLATNLPCRWQVSAGVYNVLDKDYFFPASPVGPFTRFQEPGRNYRIQATYTF